MKLPTNSQHFQICPIEQSSMLLPRQFGYRPTSLGDPEKEEGKKQDITGKKGPGKGPLSIH